jgi:hypothetical protein
VNWAAITAIGTVLAGLALPLAFIQLGALRQDRLRAQISKVGAWAGEWEPAPTKPDEQPWKIPVLIRNSSELPVLVHEVKLYLILQTSAGKTVPPLVPHATIAPGRTWEGTCEYREDPGREDQQPVQVFIRRVTATDAAGRQWEIRPYRGGPPRRVRRRGRRWRLSRGQIAGPD